MSVALFYIIIIVCSSNDNEFVWAHKCNFLVHPRSRAVYFLAQKLTHFFLFAMEKREKNMNKRSKKQKIFSQ